MRNACLRHQVLVVLQEAVQSLLAAHFAIAATHPLFSPWKKQNIFFSLMVSLSMVVLDVRCYIAFRASPIQGQYSCIDAGREGIASVLVFLYGGSVEQV